jgi:hypothetical protein
MAVARGQFERGIDRHPACRAFVGLDLVEIPPALFDVVITARPVDVHRRLRDLRHQNEILFAAVPDLVGHGFREVGEIARQELDHLPPHRYLAGALQAEDQLFR